MSVPVGNVIVIVADGLRESPPLGEEVWKDTVYRTPAALGAWLLRDTFGWETWPPVRTL